MKYRTDLILGEAFCIFIFFYFLDSGLSVLNGLQFYFRLRDSENRELVWTEGLNAYKYVRFQTKPLRVRLVWTEPYSFFHAH